MTRNRHLVSVFAAASLSVFLAHGALAQSSGKGMPTGSPRAYLAVSNGTSATLGETMKLSRTSAHFSLLKGEMKLKFSDVWKSGSDSEFGGDVYQVLTPMSFSR